MWIGSRIISPVLGKMQILELIMGTPPRCIAMWLPLARMASILESRSIVDGLRNMDRMQLYHPRYRISFQFIKNL